MKCPSCSSERVFPVGKEPLPWWLRLFARHVRCDTCLMQFYRLRGIGLMVRKGIAFCCPFF